MNDNDKYESWEKLNYELRIIGRSCIHIKLARLKIVDNSIVLKVSGPVSFDPIFNRLYTDKNFSFIIFE